MLAALVAPGSYERQATVLQTFYLILSSAKLAKSPDNAQLVSFVRRTVRHCMAHFLVDPGPMLVKMLFWKGRREAMSLAADGIVHGLKGAANEAWGKDQAGSRGKGRWRGKGSGEGEGGGGEDGWGTREAAEAAFWGDAGDWDGGNDGEGAEGRGRVRRGGKGRRGGGGGRRRGRVMGSDGEDNGWMGGDVDDDG